ncbi:vitrin isoform X1 [Lates japonicus]|uniref:Vitrin isoform X1 n=1 Tax=Lates japonicus TaxID=270547 RepID=A0AAD3NHK5_LATJO|nr:vitrin isoform X1 [Lates japonicus]
MIAITDGRPTMTPRTRAGCASPRALFNLLSLCDPGVIAYSIGIAWAAQDELEYIATDPDKEHSFFVDEFDNLYKFVPG